jgi:hypothetical protein
MDLKPRILRLLDLVADHTNTDMFTMGGHRRYSFQSQGMSGKPRSLRFLTEAAAWPSWFWRRAVLEGR